MQSMPEFFPGEKILSLIKSGFQEIMLQQTRVEAVKPYFERFVEVLPDLKALAEAEEQTLLKLWEGLGYYNRVRNMQKAARQALEEYGSLPASEEELLRLPGIGPYTAGAVASIAFGKPAAAVDGNVLRVVTRLVAYGADISKQSVRRKVAEALLPSAASAPADFNQAMMELGATVCLPNGAPKCGDCPAAHLCRAHREGRELSFPVKKPKRERSILQKTIFLLEQDGKTAIYKRPDSGLLAGLWGFPETDDFMDEREAEEYLDSLGSADGRNFFSGRSKAYLLSRGVAYDGIPGRSAQSSRICRCRKASSGEYAFFAVGKNQRGVCSAVGLQFLYKTAEIGNRSFSFFVSR